MWGLPGGHIDKGENAEKAVIREVKEETNLYFKPKFFLFTEENFKKINWYALVYFFYGKAKEIFGPYTEDYIYYDKTDNISDYNPEKAKEILKNCGYSDYNDDGIIEKNGKLLILNLNITKNRIKYLARTI